MTSDLLLAALHRAGKPITAADLWDLAVGLATAAGWPRQEIAKGNPMKAAKLLERMGTGANASVAIVGTTKENGNNRSLWAPLKPHIAAFPIPEAPQPDAEAHTLDGLSREQVLAVFDATDDLSFELQRQRRELRAYMDRQDDELARFRERARRALAAVGLGDSPTTT